MKNGMVSAIITTVQARFCLSVVFAKKALTIKLHFTKPYNRQNATDLINSKPHDYSLSTMGWSLSAQRFTSKRYRT